MKDSPGEAANQNNRAGSGICTGNGSVNSLRGILPFDPPGVGHADRIAFFQLLWKRLSRHSFKFQCPAVGGGQRQCGIAHGTHRTEHGALIGIFPGRDLQ